MAACLLLSRNKPPRLPDSTELELRPKRQRLAEVITEHLRDLILGGDLAPGVPLVQEELSSRLHISRTPLREALRTLERDGLVTTANGNGTVQVIDVQPDDARDLYQIRGVVDGLAARLAAERATPEEVDELRELAHQTLERTDPFDVKGFLIAHLRFHSRVVDISGNRRLEGFMPIVRFTSQMLYRQLPTDPERMRRSGREHLAIAEAIARGDGAQAEALARGHIDAALASWVPLVGASRLQPGDDAPKEPGK